MNESIKSAVFIAAGVVVALAAWLSRPATMTRNPHDVRGQNLYEFDPLKAASMEIVDFDETTSTPRTFQVAQLLVNGKKRWIIPSHENYEADAKDQLAEAATALVGLQIRDVASGDASEEEKYGVVDPGAKDLMGRKGVGTRVTIKDQDGKTLVALVIGNVVPGQTGGAAAGQPELHYVRKVDDDQVYAVPVRTERISSKFADWIEKDLLKMNTFDIKQVWIRDYAVDAIRGELLQNGDAILAYDDTAEGANSKWKVVKDEKFQGNSWVPGKLGPDEEVNAPKLDEMKLALEDLKIVDVRRKPAGLSAELKAGADFRANNEAVQSLAVRGFHAVKVEGREELLSNEGEIRFLMKDGVEYVLRFGATTAPTGAAKNAAPGSGEKKLNRYLLVMAEFNPDAIEKPKLDPLPPEPKPAAEADKGDKSAKGAKGEKGEKGDKAAAKTAEPKKDGAKKDDPQAALKAQRAAVEKENKRRQDEYDEKITKGRQHAKDLNGRFADWYYVIADDVYRKIHVTHDQIAKKKDKKGAKDAAGEAAHDHEHEHDHAHGDAHDEPVAPPEPGPAGQLEKLKREGPDGQK